MHAPSTSNTVPIIKPTKPETFEGQCDAAQVDRWLFQVQQYCTFVKMNNQDWVSFAALLLRGAAATWWQAKTVEAERRKTGKIQTWQEFCNAMVNQFKPANSIERARDKLANL